MLSHCFKTNVKGVKGSRAYTREKNTRYPLREKHSRVYRNTLHTLNTLNMTNKNKELLEALPLTLPFTPLTKVNFSEKGGFSGI